jgi:hypothetical protein
MASGSIKMNGLNATLLATSSMLSNTDQTITYDARGYKGILVVAHNGVNPKTATWMGCTIVPSNIEDIHTSAIALTNLNTVMDVRVQVTSTSCICWLVGSTQLAPYVTVYGLK